MNEKNRAKHGWRRKSKVYECMREGAGHNASMSTVSARSWKDTKNKTFRLFM